MRKIVVFALLALACLGTRSQTIQLLKDIWRDAGNGTGFRHDGLYAVGDTIYCNADNGVDGYELCMNVGSIQGTKMLKSFSPGAAHSHSRNFVSFDGSTYFLTKTPNDALWKTDGTTAGTQEILQFASTNQCRKLHILGSQLILMVETNMDSLELWRSDGTTLGTQLYQSLPGSLYQEESLVMGSELYFSLEGDLYKTDGTASGTVNVVDLYLPYGDYVEDLTVFNGKIWFSASDGIHGRELWYSDGTAIGTQMLEDLNPGFGNGVLSGRDFQVAGGRLYYVADDGGLSFGTEIRSTDGTVPGSVIYDYVPGSGGIQVSRLFGCDSSVFFNESQTDFFCSANAAGITQLLPRDTAFIFFDQAVSVGDSLFFLNQYQQLWRSDGTVLGTQKILPTGTVSAVSLVTNGKSVYYVGFDSNYGEGIWKTDGSASGSVAISQFGTIAQGSTPIAPTVAGNYVYFLASDSAHGRELWRTDGTEQGTLRLTDAEPGTTGVTYGERIAWQGNLYFTLGTTAAGQELWKSDGTVNGTIMLADYVLGSQGSKPKNFYPTDSFLYYMALDAQFSGNLMRTDGTPQGTIMLNNFGGQTNAGFGSIVGHVGSDLLVEAYANSSTTQLWSTNGSVGNGTLLRSFGQSSGLISSPTQFGNWVVFVADDSLGRSQIWISHGTPSSTVSLTNFTAPINIIQKILCVFKGHVYFNAYQPGIGSKLWRTNGTPTGTSIFHDPFPGTPMGDPEFLAMDDSLMFFTEHVVPVGRELWVTDGTNSSLVHDINPGTGSTDFQDAVVWDHTLYFAANSVAEGLEFYSSDGTTNSANIQAIYPGLHGGYSSIFAWTNRGLLFQASDRDQGTNLYLAEGSLVSMLPDPTYDPQSVIVSWAVPLAGGFVMGAENVEYGNELFFLDSVVNIPARIDLPAAVSVSQSIRVYPNPVSEAVQLQLQDNKDSIEGYAVYDLAGHIVLQAKVELKTECRIDMTGLPSGLYIVQADLKKGSTLSAKVVKQ